MCCINGYANTRIDLVCNNRGGLKNIPLLRIDIIIKFDYEICAYVRS